MTTPRVYEVLMGSCHTLEFHFYTPPCVADFASKGVQESFYHFRHLFCPDLTIKRVELGATIVDCNHNPSPLVYPFPLRFMQLSSNGMYYSGRRKSVAFSFSHGIKKELEQSQQNNGIM